MVIGGGDTGSDCIGTANRQGAKSITQIEIMPKPPVRENREVVWPLWPQAADVDLPGGRLRTAFGRHRVAARRSRAGRS